MDKKNNHLLEKSSSIVLSFIIFILLTVLTLVIGIYAGMFHKSVLLKNLYISDYGEEVQSYLYSQCEDIAMSGSVPKEVLDDIFPIVTVKHDINKYAEASIAGKEYEIDFTPIDKKIRSNINNYLTKENIVLDDEQEKELTEFSKAIEREYKLRVKVPFINYYTKFKAIFDKIFIITVAITIVLSALAIFFIFRMHEWKHRAVRYLVYSALSTMLVTIVTPIIFLINGSYKRLNFKPQYFYNLVVETVAELLKTFIYLGILWIVIAALLLLLVQRMKNCSVKVTRKKKK